MICARNYSSAMCKSIQVYTIKSTDSFYRYIVWMWLHQNYTN